MRAALAEPDVAAIVCARGGYGVSRFAHRIDWRSLREQPRWIVGFSDNTALHVEANRVSVASIHGCHVTGLGRGDAVQRDAFVDVLEHPTAPRRFAELEPELPGVARGRLFVANLALLHACAAAGRLSLPHPTVLLLEDIGERPYRIDRMLSTLLVGRHLDGVVGVVLGEFSQCGPGPDGVEVTQLTRELLAPRSIPLASGAPVGHGLRNAPLVVGSTAQLEVTDGRAELVMRT
jgi:muramoyltetrapeptide carboxypeptidase